VWALGTLFGLGVAACIPERTATVQRTAPLRATLPDTTSRAADLVRVDFEGAALGPFGPAELASSFGLASSSHQGFSDGRASIVASDHGKSLRVSYPRGSVGPSAGGAQFFVNLPGAHDELYCSYRVRFREGFDFVKGGKLPGLVGGSRPTGGRPDDGGFSARLMWRTGGAVVQYVYHPHQTSKYGVDLPYDGARFQPGAWHTVTHRVVMNTAGRANGIIQGWFDGRLALDKHDALLRVDGSVHIDGLYFSTFFGGNDDSWGATRDEYVDFDDFVVSPTASPPT
jgi:hypothetical protein